MTSVLLAIVMFTAIVLLLVLLLMSARNKLVATGDVSIVVNEDESKALKVAAGGTLLGALTSNKIFVPAAVGQSIPNSMQKPFLPPFFHTTALTGAECPGPPGSVTPSTIVARVYTTASPGGALIPARTWSARTRAIMVVPTTAHRRRLVTW